MSESERSNAQMPRLAVSWSSTTSTRILGTPSAPHFEQTITMIKPIHGIAAFPLKGRILMPSPITLLNPDSGARPVAARLTFFIQASTSPGVSSPFAKGAIVNIAGVEESTRTIFLLAETVQL